MKFSYADAARKLSEVEVDEKETLLNEEVMYLGSYANAVEVENGMKPPAYEAVHPATVTIDPPLSPPSTTLLSIYSEPIRVEYEESERVHRAGCSDLLWNYFACCGLSWTLIGCFCCVIPLITLLIIFLRV